ncbi:MAG: biotin synthase BioB, partial [Bacillota bacterium]
MLHELTGDIIQGQDFSLEQALHLYTSPEIKLPQLIAAAARVTEHFHYAGRVELCAIASARSGRCSEDCAFCAQSARYQTGAPVYPLLTPQEILPKAQQAAHDGATRFSIVTSGRGISQSDLDQVLRAVELIRRHTELEVCASLGIISYQQARQLKAAGLSMYHHNLETCRAFYSRICTTHSWEERVATIHAARQAGLKVCAGGIIGLGESPR